MGRHTGHGSEETARWHHSDVMFSGALPKPGSRPFGKGSSGSWHVLAEKYLTQSGT